MREKESWYSGTGSEGEQQKSKAKVIRHHPLNLPAYYKESSVPSQSEWVLFLSPDWVRCVEPVSLCRCVSVIERELITVLPDLCGWDFKGLLESGVVEISFSFAFLRMCVYPPRNVW